MLVVFYPCKSIPGEHLTLINKLGLPALELTLLGGLLGSPKLLERAARVRIVRYVLHVRLHSARQALANRKCGFVKTYCHCTTFGNIGTCTTLLS